MGRKKVNLIAAIPAALVGIICGGIGAVSGTESSKKLILEKGSERLCSRKRKK